jgi:hypothetical protein
MKIKTYLLLLILFLGMQQIYSQDYRFKTSGFSVLEKNEKGKWGDWSNLDLVNILVSLDTKKKQNYYLFPSHPAL